MHIQHNHQKGISLIELLIGIAIGLITLAVAMGALMASRSVTGTVADASQLQQQASHIFRIFGQQLRQAGSLRLNLATQKADTATTYDANDLVAFEASASGFDTKVDVLSGIDNPGANAYKLTAGYRNYKEPIYPSSALESLQRDCLGQQDNANPNRIQSRFVLDGSNLMCAGSGLPQPIASNVANFQVRYLLQSFPGSKGEPHLRYVNATDVGNNWSNVYAVEICLVLFGTEILPEGGSYTDCPSADGTSANIATNSLNTPRTNRLHKTFRTVFQLRSQGLLTSY